MLYQQPLGGLVRFLFHRDGLFTFPVPEIVEFRAPDIALAFNFDFGDSGRVQREHAFDAFAIGNSAHGKKGI